MSHAIHRTAMDALWDCRNAWAKTQDQLTFDDVLNAAPGPDRAADGSAWSLPGGRSVEGVGENRAEPRTGTAAAAPSSNNEGGNVYVIRFDFGEGVVMYAGRAKDSYGWAETTDTAIQCETREEAERHLNAYGPETQACSEIIELVLA